MSTLVWHNPRCSKSRQTTELLSEKGIVFEIRHYLDNAPSKAELKSALKELGLEVLDLARTKEALFKELDLKGKNDEDLLGAMAANPKLIERPVVFHEGKARIGRPPESVLELFE
ncbi:MAG: arsenate reductase (glutaredoxin) [Deltaproteobacteria bacterium]|nr:arsenate reductase (glutaredoxin) [Deltaproteobacteria bacterium]